MPHKILIVDDDVDSLKLIGLMLQRQGYQVDAANTGSQALDKISQEQPDLIILDVMMPDMNGYEICRRLRTKDSTRHIPIIMFTAKTLIDDKVAGFEAGADDYLTKPTHPAELASRVEAILQRVPKREDVSSVSGSTIGVLSVKGGIGATTLVVNLATGFKEVGEHPIVVDFRMGASTLGLMLGIEQLGTMAGVVKTNVNEVIPEFLARKLLTHEGGLRLLTASAQPSESQMNVQPEVGFAVVDGLRKLGAPVIVDLGSELSQFNHQLLKAMDTIVLVIEPSPVALSMAQALMKELSTYSPRIELTVMNRYQAKNSGGYSWQEIERALNCEIRAMIAAVPELAIQAMRSGQPILTIDPDSIFSSQVRKLAHMLSVRSTT
jgi:pilus assembly protein CpaE